MAPRSESTPLLREEHSLTPEAAAATAQRQHDPPLRLRTKLAFMLGAFPSVATHSVIGFFMSPFLLEVAGVSPLVVSLCAFVGRAWDAVTDPLVGYLVSQQYSRFGYLKPWMAVAVLPAVLLYTCLWAVPEISSASKTGYYLCIYLGYQTFFSLYQVPYTSLTVHLSNDPVERDSATTWRMGMETLSLFFGSVVQGIIVSSAISVAPVCRPCDDDGGGGEEPAEDKSVQYAYLLSAIVISCLALIFGALCLMGVPERPDGETPRKQARVRPDPVPESRSSAARLRSRNT